MLGPAAVYILEVFCTSYTSTSGCLYQVEMICLCYVVEDIPRIRVERYHTSLRSVTHDSEGMKLA